MNLEAFFSSGRGGDQELVLLYVFYQRTTDFQDLCIFVLHAVQATKRFSPISVSVRLRNIVAHILIFLKKIVFRLTVDIGGILVDLYS